MDRSKSGGWGAIGKYPLESALCALLLAIVLATFAQVVFRYVVHFSLGWSEELARYLFMWFAMLGAAYGFKKKSHFALVFVFNLFGPLGRRLVNRLVVSGMSVFLVVFVAEALRFTWTVRDQISPGIHISRAVPYSSTVVGGLLMLYYIIRNAWNDLYASPELVQADATRVSKAELP